MRRGRRRRGQGIGPVAAGAGPRSRVEELRRDQGRVPPYASEGRSGGRPSCCLQRGLSQWVQETARGLRRTVFPKTELSPDHWGQPPLRGDSLRFGEWWEAPLAWVIPWVPCRL